MNNKEKTYYVSYREYNEYNQFEGDWNLQLKECQTLEEAQKFVEDVKGGRYRNDFRDFKILVGA